MQNVSFNEDYWASQPLSNFIEEAAHHKWSEQDATVYHNKIRKDRGIAVNLPPEIKPDVNILEEIKVIDRFSDDNQREDNPTERTAISLDGDSAGSDSGEPGDTNETGN